VVLIRRLKSCEEIVAGDNTRLRELFHPDRSYRFSGRYSLAHATIPVGEASLEHRLKTSEVYYILSGTGMMHVDSGTAPVETGCAIEIPPGSIQWLENTGPDDLRFLCVVDPAWKSEDEEVL
jgi:mannose-6-phosphate isomerase-like protein (cupin superfamily)